MSNNILEMTESQLQCTVCCEVIVEANTINCGHTFCEYCLHKWQKKKSNCPLCRTPIYHKVAVRILDEFVDNLYRQLASEDGLAARASLKLRREAEKEAEKEADREADREARDMPDLIESDIEYSDIEDSDSEESDENEEGDNNIPDLIDIEDVEESDDNGQLPGRRRLFGNSLAGWVEGWGFSLDRDRYNRMEDEEEEALFRSVDSFEGHSEFGNGN